MKKIIRKTVLATVAFIIGVIAAFSFHSSAEASDNDYKKKRLTQPVLIFLQKSMVRQ